MPQSVRPNPSRRKLTPEEYEVILELYRRKDGTVSRSGQYFPTHAYVTLTAEISHGDQDTVEVYPPGTTLKIVMVSRFGDCGLTGDLNAESGYFVRVQFDDPIIVDIRWQPAPTKEWKEFLSGIIAKVAPCA